MRRFVGLLLLLCLLGRDAQGQSSPEIGSIRLGLPSAQGGDQTGRSRRGAWAPVYVRLKGGSQGNAHNQLQLAVVSRDSEQTLSRYAVPIPTLSSQEEKTLLAYLRPEGLTQFDVQILDPGEHALLSKTSTVAELNREILGSGAILYGTLGSPLSLSRALRPEEKKADLPGPEDPDGEDAGQRRYVSITQAQDLPDRWFGYEAADVLFLATANKTFVTALVEGDPARREALAEWVARGGKLVLSVAQEHQLVQRLLEQTRLIDVAIRGSRERETLAQVYAWTGGDQPPTKFEIADLEVGPGASVLIREEPQGADRAERPVVVQGAYGLGRVILVGFDLESPKFTVWSGQRTFWQKLDGMLAPRMPATRPGQPGAVGKDLPPGGWEEGLQGGPTELQAALRRQLETFATIPVISFGWVALFILFYILLVGPIDYFILKRFFKRLELTWITFPLIVVLVSVGAYLGAYYSKGDDLRINKVDLVQVDLHSAEAPQVYGTTWFSLFSPRIQNYTLGLEPSPDWTEPLPQREKHSGTTLALLPVPEQAARIGSQGLFPQPYDFAPDASGLKQVPIPVWSSRAFVSQWRAPAKKGLPPVSADLSRSRLEAGSIQGAITNNLEAPLESVYLFFEGRLYSLGTLDPGQTKRAEQEVQRQRGQERAGWKDSAVFRGSGANLATIKAALFPELTGEGLNNGLRSLDESWRLNAQPEYKSRATPNWRPEVVLVARLQPVTERGANLNPSPQTASRLWLGDLPGPGKSMPELEGSLSQETYLRVFIPVKPAP